MKYYSSMTLADYVAANWLEMDPNLVKLVEDESRHLAEAREDADNWNENYHDVLSAAEHFQRDLQSLIDDYTHARISFDDFLIDLRTSVRDVVFDL